MDLVADYDPLCTPCLVGVTHAHTAAGLAPMFWCIQCHNGQHAWCWGGSVQFCTCDCGIRSEGGK